MYNGQEGVSTGIIKASEEKDYVCSIYFDHVHALRTGFPSKLVLVERFGKERGCSRDRGGSMHMFSAPHNFFEELHLLEKEFF